MPPLSPHSHKMSQVGSNPRYLVAQSTQKIKRGTKAKKVYI